jgi:hypothetical protein
MAQDEFVLPGIEYGSSLMTEFGLARGSRGEVILSLLNCAEKSHPDCESTESSETFTSDI